MIDLKKNFLFYFKWELLDAFFSGEDFENQRDDDNNNIICSFESVTSLFCVSVFSFEK